MTDSAHPTRDIVDAHHHLWPGTFRDGAVGEYLLEDLRGDAGAAVTDTVFVECGTAYRPDGPEHLRPVGETEFVAGVAAASDAGPGARIAGIVGHADLTLPLDLLDEVLDAHESAAGGRFRGIRDALCSAPPDVALLIAGDAEADRGARPEMRRGVAHLGARGLTYDTWQYHFQLPEFVALARSAPGTTVVLDHFSTPLGVGPWAGKHDEIFETWKRDLGEAAACPNVVAKLGGLSMPDNGFWPLGVRPNVEEFVAAQARWYHVAIDTFGPDRCLFESNFPVDKFTVDYAVLLAAFEQIIDRYTPDEQAALWAGTARRVYRL